MSSMRDGEKRNFDCWMGLQLGKRVVKASLALGHETYLREEICVDIEKVQMLLGFKEQGAHRCRVLLTIAKVLLMM
ncbi:hypothetical protein Pint_03579 [Pistacia integerrima]|uniref:Uncharacterized protein n=1 Tax=Pistacia integerrima TaxID=434235 RepID=A0ACC0ZJI4_9ROSI|nr:hypothetical protein Pint_03579 [Pistacia integerrima]